MRMISLMIFLLLGVLARAQAEEESQKGEELCNCQPASEYCLALYVLKNSSFDEAMNAKLSDLYGQKAFVYLHEKYDCPVCKGPCPQFHTEQRSCWFCSTTKFDGAEIREANEKWSEVWGMKLTVSGMNEMIQDFLSEREATFFERR